MNPMLMELLPLVHRGYNCAQLLVMLMLQAMDRENAGVVRAAHGLCHGIGMSGGPCGLLTGGACALALAAGKGADEEVAHPMLTPMLNDYATWFYERTAAYGGSDCSRVASGLGAGSGESGEQPNPAACGELLAECWENILELVQNYELDLTRGL